MKLKRFIGGSLESNGYVLYDTESREALIINPGYKAETFSDFLKRENLDLKGPGAGRGLPDRQSVWRVRGG